MSNLNPLTIRTYNSNWIVKANVFDVLVQNGVP